MSSEYERYVNSDFVTHLHPKEFASFDKVLGFWKEKETMFPVLSRMAMDIISVQASSVASESAFSTSGRVLSIRRTRLTPASLEMCMCLKDHLDAKERKQDKCPLETPLDFGRSCPFDDRFMSSASSAVTYTSVYTDSEPGRVFWGADEEISDGDVPRVIVYGYDGLPMQPVAPPSPDYVPGPEHPPSPIEIPFVPEPEGGSEERLRGGAAEYPADEEIGDDDPLVMDTDDDDSDER
ncbi:zinc finger BED domain-containing protein RICESLEEPER 2 [Tanacetum coccineum]|uniref:Zinc finger BED domain-containing protein RICESLEEPER 2 n=1 Tax=Tanacetum coccineum TaxID=301880 RepID=A0ABQ5HDA8_9ASTR